MLVALDIETRCTQKCDVKCSHALFPQYSEISIVGIWNPDFAATFTVDSFKKFLIENPNLKFVMHNGKFDVKHLRFHGVNIDSNNWVHDTQLMASASITKIPDEWLERYEARRKEENKKLPHGYSHREARGGSLKTLAPYFLGVDAFWENPADHSSEEYVLKDCEYTYRLCQFFLDEMARSGTLKFYEEKLFNWTRDLLLPAEERGVVIDNTRLKRKELVAKRRSEDVKKKLDSLWEEAYKAYEKKITDEIVFEYKKKTEDAILRIKSPTESKVASTRLRYSQLLAKRLAAHPVVFNINSDDQMLWLLRDYFKLDTKVRSRDKDTNVITDKDSTGVEVLNRLAQEGRKDIQLLLEYREYNKLATAFYPNYRELMCNGKIHTNFNITGTRTGRLSCSEPNLQQVPAHLHSLFIARPGYSLACFDESGIEARLIAYYSEDPVLCDLVINDKDIHGFHANIFFQKDWDLSIIKKQFPNERQLAKNVGFGLFYGAGPNRIKQEAMRMGYAWDDRHCRKLYQEFRKTYKEVFEYKDELDRQALDSPIGSLSGRRHSFVSTPEDIYMKCFNTLIQGSASDLVIMSAYKAQQEYKKKNIDAHFLIAVHDELVFEVNNKQKNIAVEILIKSMTDYKLDTRHGNIPLKVEGKVGRQWSK